MSHKKLGLHIVGGLGDVSLTKKYPVLFQTDLAAQFEIKSIADVYETERVKDGEKLARLLEEIKSKRIKGKFPSDLETIFRNSLQHSIRYFQLDKSNPLLSDNFFDSVEENDIVDISVPNKLHVPLVRQVLMRGGNLLVEKPLCSSLEEAIEFEEKISSLDTNNQILTDAEHYSHYGNIRMFYDNFDRFSKDNAGGFGLGSIKSIHIAIKEDEDFNSERNKEMIEISRSGGGMWLDTGIHAISFLRCIGATIDHDSVHAQPYKSSDKNIQEDKYGETSMCASFNLLPNKHFSPDCYVKIEVGKCFPKKEKRFTLNYQNGRLELDMPSRSLSVYDQNNLPVVTSIFSRDAFYYVFDDLRKCATYNEKPFTSIAKALKSTKDVFLIYAKAKPIIKEGIEDGKLSR